MIVPDRTFSFGEKNLEVYRALAKELTPPGGKSPSNRDLFLIAMAWGFRNGARVEEFKRSNTGPRTEIKEEDIALMAMIALASNDDADTILEPERVFQTAEQYAEGGILLLAKMIDEPGEFARSFAVEVREHAADRVQAG